MDTIHNRTCNLIGIELQGNTARTAVQCFRGEYCMLHQLAALDCAFQHHEGQAFGIMREGNPQHTGIGTYRMHHRAVTVNDGVGVVLKVLPADRRDEDHILFGFFKRSAEVHDSAVQHVGVLHVKGGGKDGITVLQGGEGVALELVHHVVNLFQMRCVIYRTLHRALRLCGRCNRCSRRWFRGSGRNRIYIEVVRNLAAVTVGNDK